MTKKARRTGNSRLWALAALMVCLSSASLSAVAMAGDADALVKEGIALRREGKDEAALKKFEEANAVQRSPRVLAQIGLAEQALGRWGAADRHLHAALAESDDPWIAKNRKSIEKALKVVGQHTGQLEIAGSPAGSEVLVDGELVGTLPLPRPVGATTGVVAIEVRSSGYIPVVRSTQITTGGLTRESFNLQPSAAPAVEPPPGPVAVRRDPASFANAKEGATDGAGATSAGSEPSSGAAGSHPPPGDDVAAKEGMAPSRVVAFAAGGLAVGALGFGVFEHLKWQDRVSKFSNDQTCDAGASNRGSPACQTLYDDGHSARTWAFVSYGVAGAFAATAVILFLVSPDSAPAQKSVACGTGPGSWGLACGGRF